MRTGHGAVTASLLFAAASLFSALLATPFLDRLTGLLLILSASLFGVVCHYSVRYMAGDSRQPRFTLWLCITGSCVFALVLAQDMLFFAFAWCGISLSLHQLLQCFRERPGAVLAARKKFLVSRLGDSALLAAVLLTSRHLGTTRFQDIAAKADRFRLATPSLPPAVSLIACLLVFAALLKSAQFPFHSWLPDTMETPTPVSALMHAGIINAGGILVLRMHSLIALSHAAMLLLCVVGAFTAIFASVVMLTQASVKRYLAFSTVAQMGFMMLECGLGAFHLALLHLVAHSLYKAWSFLAAGNAVLTSPKPPHQAVSLPVIFGGIIVACGMTLAAAATSGVSVSDQPVLTGIFTLALAQLLWTCTPNFLPSLGLAAAASLAYFALERTAGIFLLPSRLAPNEAALPILGLFALATLLQTRMRMPLFDAVYVHARNGFYINTLANRLTTALWPVSRAKEQM